MVKVIWTTHGDHTTEWESSWLDFLFGDIATSHVHDPNLEHLPDANAHTQCVIIVNPKSPEQNVATNSYLLRYENAGIPFGVVHLSDEFLNCNYHFYQYSNCRFIYRNYWHPLLCQGKVRCFPMGYKKGFAQDVNTEKDRQFSWCFSGNLKYRHPERIRGLQVFQNLDNGACIIEQGDSFSNPITGLNTEKYRQLLESSIFALCPPGNVHLDSFRMYEALEAGAIPVTLSRTPQQPHHPSYWAHVFQQTNIPFVMEDTWEKCLNKVEKLLSNDEELKICQRECAAFWQKSKQDVKDAFHKSFEELSAHTKK